MAERYGKTFATLGKGVPENAGEAMAQQVSGYRKQVSEQQYTSCTIHCALFPVT